jgi:phenylalanine ammonia-lyase
VTVAFPIGERRVTTADVVAVARAGAAVQWSARPAVRRRVRRSREHLLAALRQGDVIYGVNTGVGTNAVFALPAKDAERFQETNLRQLCCGSGPPLPGEIVRGAMLLRAVTLALGYSAVREEVVEQLVRLLNAGITPVTPRYGSVGASGDLVPSAYIARALLGQGSVWYRGRERPAGRALAAAGIAPLRLSYKEGLALVNGTTVMTAAAALAVHDAEAVLRAFLAACALAIEALGAPAEPFADFVQRAKGHAGQRAVGRLIRELLRGSRAVARGKVRMQSGYSVRCLPQGIGPMYETLAAARRVVETEANSANDNPLVDPATGRIYSAGNFYGGHVARAMDGLKLDLANLANWCHALMAVLVDDRFSNGLPPALAARPGRDTGFKGMQLSLASLAAGVRQMASPSTVHPISTEQHNQDMVSLGVHAALTARDALECARDAVSILLLAACQAVDLRPCADRLGEGSARAYRAVRRRSAFVQADRPLARDIAAVSSWITEV